MLKACRAVILRHVTDLAAAIVALQEILAKVRRLALLVKAQPDVAKSLADVNLPHSCREVGRGARGMGPEQRACHASLACTRTRAKF